LLKLALMTILVLRSALVPPMSTITMNNKILMIVTVYTDNRINSALPSLGCPRPFPHPGTKENEVAPRHRRHWRFSSFAEWPLGFNYRYINLRHAIGRRRRFPVGAVAGKPQGCGMGTRDCPSRLL
jgi:hypothetical protein